jgi:HTH-type transcriptional regulator/antitoxin HigA
MEINMKSIWYLIENDDDYQSAISRYEVLKNSKKETFEHKEKLLLVKLINDYENSTSTLPDVDPIEMIKIRMKDFGYKSSDLASIYGDKGTVSKVLNYKQSLSLNMIRKFSAFLNIPIQSLLKEYQLNP